LDPQLTKARNRTDPPALDRGKEGARTGAKKKTVGGPSRWLPESTNTNSTGERRQGGDGRERGGEQ